MAPNDFLGIACRIVCLIDTRSLNQRISVCKLIAMAMFKDAAESLASESGQSSPIVPLTGESMKSAIEHVRRIDSSRSGLTRYFHVVRIACCVLMTMMIVGCGDIEWNWDLAWWKQPRRVVRPTRPNEPREQPRQDTVAGKAEDQRSSNPGNGQPPGETPVAQSGRTNTESKPIPDRPFYYLYFLSGDASKDDSTRGETRIVLSHAPALAASRVMEMLYIPLGRSGSASESYVIYENQSEFRAAASFASSLDIEPARLPTSAVGPEMAFDSGVAMLLGAIDAGPGSDTKLIESCEHRFVEAVQSTDLPPIIRWAAGILAGRVASQYRYDHAEARSYYKQAERLVQDGSIEKMTARWWRADSLIQEGSAPDAMKVYQEILDVYGKDNTDSHIVRRAHILIQNYNKQ